VLRCRGLEPTHFFTSATLHLRNDEREWTAVAELAGLSHDRLRLLHQVHGNRIVVAGGAGTADTRPEADGIISEDPSVALVVRVADCAPILMSDRRLGVVAAIHAGWRSTMQSIVARAVDALAGTYGSRPQDLTVAIGPSLGPCCGEMGEEVVDAFRQAGHSMTLIDRWFVRAPGRRPHFDLWRANVDQLTAKGVEPEAIQVSGLCTRTYADQFHSYRAAGASAGRMAGVIRANR
jgi:YfiH family protein